MDRRNFKNGFWFYGNKKNTKETIEEIKRLLGEPDTSFIPDFRIKDIKKFTKIEKNIKKGKWVFYPPVLNKVSLYDNKFIKKINLRNSFIFLSYFGFRSKKDYLKIDIKNKLGKKFIVI